jgi:LCP family protein required for cell wall assembly
VSSQTIRTPIDRTRPRSPVVAAFLSFIWPGLGQWYAGRPRVAAVLALPVLLMVLLLAVWLAGGLARALIDLLAPPVAIAFILLVVAEGIWRIGAVVHAAMSAAGRDSLPWRRLSVSGPVLALSLLVVISHLWAVSVAWSLYNASGQMFVGEPTPIGALPGQSSTPSSFDGLAASPAATPVTASSRINILFSGIDSSAHREHALTDTLIVLTVDPTTDKAAMISFPRDIARFKIWDGRTYTGKINSLLTYATNHPTEYPEGGLPTLTHELGFLLGVPIQYYAAVDLQGFVELVDAVGGVTVNNPRAIDDPGYGGWTDGRIGFTLSAGVHELDGQTALAYARSRKGIGDSDFTRARRQQQLLVALRDRLTDPSLLVKLPSIITIASTILRTDFPRDRLSDMLTLSQRISGNDLTRQVVLGPPYAINPPAGTPGGYQLILDMSRVAKLSIGIFGTDSRYAAASAPSSPAPP